VEPTQIFHDFPGDWVTTTFQLHGGEKARLENATDAAKSLETKDLSRGVSKPFLRIRPQGWPFVVHVWLKHAQTISNHNCKDFILPENRCKSDIPDIPTPNEESDIEPKQRSL